MEEIGTKLLRVRIFLTQLVIIWVIAINSIWIHDISKILTKNKYEILYFAYCYCGLV